MANVYQKHYLTEGLTWKQLQEIDRNIDTYDFNELHIATIKLSSVFDPSVGNWTGNAVKNVLKKIETKLKSFS